MSEDAHFEALLVGEFSVDPRDDDANTEADLPRAKEVSPTEVLAVHGDRHATTRESTDGG